MTSEEYRSLIQEIRNPYSIWIRNEEGRSDMERPGEGGLFSSPGEEGGTVPGKPVIRRSAGPLLKDWDDRYVFFLWRDGTVDPELPSLLRNYVKDDGGDFIYGDEDIADPLRRDPWFKPDWSPDTIREFYYPGGFTMVSRRLLARMEASGEPMEESPEFLMKCALKAENHIHIPHVIYHAFSENSYRYQSKWETSEERTDQGAITRDTDDRKNLISVVILSKDHPDLLESCVRSLSLAAESEGVLLETVVVDNGSSHEKETVYRALSDKYNFRYYMRPMPFLYSRLCNLGASFTEGGYLLFLNDDVEVPEGTRFLRAMASAAGREHAGAVGCRLLYPGGRLIQHCGITLLRSGPSHKLCGYPDDRDYYHGINRLDRDVFAVTGACLMVRRSVFQEAGGFDEALAAAYTDVDLCAVFLEMGLYNLCLNRFALIHHESVTRDDDIRDPAAYERLLSEREYFTKKHRELLSGGDPFYSPNLTDTGLDYRVRVPTPEERHRAAGTLPTVPDFLLRSLKRDSRRVRLNLESVTWHLSDACENRDFWEFRGWAFAAGSPGWKYDVWLLFQADGVWRRAGTARTERPDVEQVFPDEKDLRLSGFLARIKGSCLPEGWDTLAICLVKPSRFRRSGWTGFFAEVPDPRVS